MTLEAVSFTGYGGYHVNTELPKILIELQQFTVSGPLTGAAANTAIAVTDGIDIQDTILKVLEFTAGVPSDITSTVSIVDLRAKGTLTLSGVVAGDSVQVNGTAYKFQNITVTNSTNLPPGIVPVGPTDTATAANLAAAITNDPQLTATSVGTVVTVICDLEGTAGNAITLSAALSNGHITASGATLSGGSATNAIKSTANTTGNTLVMFWFKKDRNVLQP